MSSSANSVALVEQITPPTFEHFQRDYALKGVPVVIRGAIEHWKARTHWNFEYLASKAGSVSIGVTKSNANALPSPDIEPNIKFEKLRIDAYIASLMQENKNVSANTSIPLTNIPGLAEDIEVPSYIDRAALHAAYIWIASSNALTRLHYDPYHNLYACISGRKKVILIAPKFLPQVYPHPWHSKYSHHSRVDIDNPDLTRFPRFAEVTRLETTLEPGDMLFIPIDWWHQVYGLDNSIVVNLFWHASLRQFVSYPQLHKFRYLKSILLTRLIGAVKAHSRRR